MTLENTRETTVAQTDSLDVTGQLTETFHGGRRTTIDAGDEVTVASGNSISTVSAGQYLVSSSGQLKLTQNESHFLRLDNLVRLGTSEGFQVFNGVTMVEGDRGGTLTLSADTEIKLECGAGSISVKSDGTIEIVGTTVELKSGGSGVKVEGPGSSVSGPAVRIGGGSTVDVQASVIKLN